MGESLRCGLMAHDWRHLDSDQRSRRGSGPAGKQHVVSENVHLYWRSTRFNETFTLPDGGTSTFDASSGASLNSPSVA